MAIPVLRSQQKQQKQEQASADAGNERQASVPAAAAAAGVSWWRLISRDGTKAPPAAAVAAAAALDHPMPSQTDCLAACTRRLAASCFLPQHQQQQQQSFSLVSRRRFRCASIRLRQALEYRRLSRTDQPVNLLPNLFFPLVSLSLSRPSPPAYRHHRQ